MTDVPHTGRSPVTRGPNRPPPPPGRDATVAGLLGETGRQIVPIRYDFVQQGHGPTTRPGPLSRFIKAHDERGLEAYLLVHAMASSSPPPTVTLEAGTWVRALGIGERADGSIDPLDASARSAVSKVMKRLEERGLIARSRKQRKSMITLLREDGLSRHAYERPEGKSREDRWMRLPHAYWTAGHYRDLSLPAKTVLLIALSLPDAFPLPEENGVDWYGVSADSIGAGIRELIKKGFLAREMSWVPANRSAIGHTQVNLYTLIGPYSHAARTKAALSRRSEAPGAGADLDQSDTSAPAPDPTDQIPDLDDLQGDAHASSPAQENQFT